MTGPVIAIDVDTLRAHASRVATVQSDVAEAAAAVRSLDLAGGAFGILCAFLVPPAQIVAAIAESMIVAADSMLERTGDELRAIATHVEAQEREIADDLRALHRQLR